MAQGKKPPAKTKAPREALDPADLRAAAALLLDLAAEHEALAGTLRVGVGTRVALVGGAGAGDGLSPPGGPAAVEERAKPSRALRAAVGQILEASEQCASQQRRDLLLAHADAIRAVLDDAITQAAPAHSRRHRDGLPPTRELVVREHWPRVCEHAAPGLERIVSRLLGRAVGLEEVTAALSLLKPHHYEKGGVQGLALVFAGAISGDAMRGETRDRALARGLASGTGLHRQLTDQNRRARAFRYALLALGYDERREDEGAELAERFWRMDLDVFFPLQGVPGSAFDLVVHNIRAAGIVLAEGASEQERLEAARLACLTMGMSVEDAWAEVERWAVHDPPLRAALDEERAITRR
jgi:hypothetical protein